MYYTYCYIIIFRDEKITVIVDARRSSRSLLKQLMESLHDTQVRQIRHTIVDMESYDVYFQNMKLQKDIDVY